MSLKLGRHHVRSPGDVCLDQAMGFVDGKENAGLSGVVLVLNATFLFEGKSDVVDVGH